MTFDTSILYSTTKNLMGVAHSFGYIPPHGKRLGPNQSYTVPGNIIDRIVNGGATRGGWNQQRFRSFERDLRMGRIAIVKTPPPIFYDSSAAAAVANPTVAITDTTGSGTVMTLPTGSYDFWYTWTNANGETTVGASKIASPVSITASTTQLTLTVPSLPSGATGVNIYAALHSAGLAAAQLLYSHSSGGTLSAISATFATLASPPSTNTAAVIPAPVLQPAVNPTGAGATGGSLQAGTYFLEYTFTNANGETTPSPESAQFTVAAGNIPTVLLQPAPPGTTGINIYLTGANGSSGTETEYTSIPIPAGATGFPSNLTGYLQPGIATNPELAGCLYALSAATVSGGASPPGSNTAVISIPTVQPLVQVLGATSTLTPPGNLAGYLEPGLFNTINQQGLAYGGQLQPGTYYLKYTYNTAAGETPPSPESNQFTVTAGQVPLALLVSPSRDQRGPGYDPPGGYFPEGVTSVNVYLTPANGSSGSEVLYLSGVTTGVVKLSAPQGLQEPPLANTTAGHTILTLKISGDTLGVVDPTWGSYEGPA